MKTKLVIIRAYDNAAYYTVKKSIDELHIEVVNGPQVDSGRRDILTRMTHKQALKMLNVTNNTDAVMMKGEA